MALLVPRLTAYAAVLLAITMACAAVTHLAVIGGSAVPALVLGVLSTLVAVRRWGSR